MTYQPNKAILPGNTILRTLKREGMTQKNLSDRTGLSEKHLSQIINGEASITLETAFLLENALGGSTSFWINLESNYQETKARIDRISLLSSEVDLLPKFPYAELAKRGYVQSTTKKVEKIENLWKFFGVNSLNYISKIQPVAYRKNDKGAEKDESIATWLRCGEIDARENKVNNFSETTLKDSISELRLLSTKKPEEFSVLAKEMLGKSGVSLVYVPHFKGTGVSGAVRWVGENPIIQLSLLGTYADIFWFNLFHEIGHLILHGKKEQFLEFEKPIMDEKENEANEFAANGLIPKKDYLSFLEANELSTNSIKAFAEKLNVHPGIVEGRLRHDKKMKWEKPSVYRTRLTFEKAKAA